MLIKVLFWFGCVAHFTSSLDVHGPLLVEERIVGGFPAKVRYKFMASYQTYLETKDSNGTLTGEYNNYHFCGASIVFDDCLVTAAHCVAADYPQQSVVVGVNHLDDPMGERYNVQYTVMHSKYKAFEGNDIAVIRLEKPIQYTNRVGPIRLSKTYIDGGVYLRLIGWGHVDPTKLFISLPRDLHELRTWSIPNWLCKATPLYQPTESDICTLRTGNGANNGDSGGPLFRVENGTEILVGITSFGFSISSILPDVHTRVSEYVKWIHEKCGRPYN